MIADNRIIAEILLKKFTEEEWKKAIRDENVLQKKSVNSAARNAHTLRKRLGCMNDAFLTALINASDRAYIQLSMVTLLIHSPIVLDFMRQCLAEARRTYKPTLSMDAWGNFIDMRHHTFPELEHYSKATLKKMGNNAVKALVDGGYLNTSRQRQILPVYLLPEVKAILLKIGREDIAEIMECTL